MSKELDRASLVKEICKAARLYKEHLVGNRFLYAFDGRYIEVLYKVANFKHLTGVETNLSAKKFYEYAVKNQLQASQIHFSAQHPYMLCTRKIKHICQVATLASSECFMLEEIKTNTQTYKFGTTDLNFSLCMNKEFDRYGYAKDDCYIVQSLRDEECFSKSKSAYVVTHILSRKNDAKAYTELRYMNQSSTLEDLSAQILAMVDLNLLSL